ncbi:hypothetical protein B0T14DRAFT_518220 [Immersiella caudata]|uniref:Uncharacterized protein n=1 Tax=Immersiella caudata TaxID=314043 RepID=A0AA40BZ66_9PEZI|nr:hypothetical protein B0T14DRAFT_518220 [Immersiella caudata]
MDALCDDIFGPDVGGDTSDNDSDHELDAQYARGSALRCAKCRYEPKLCKACRLQLKQHAAKTSTLERVSASLRPPRGIDQQPGKGCGSWWSLWDSPPPTYHAEVRRRGAEPSRIPTSAPVRPQLTREEVLSEHLHWKPASTELPDRLRRSHESQATGTRVRMSQTRSLQVGSQVDVREISSVHFQSTASFMDFDTLDLELRFAEIERRTLARFHHCGTNHANQVHRNVHPNSLQIPEDIAPSTSPYEQQLVRCIYKVPYTRGTGHAVGLAMWHLWDPNRLESWERFGYKRVVLRCAGIVGFAQITLNGCLPESVGIWQVLFWIGFVEWPRRFLNIMLDSLQQLAWRLWRSEVAMEDVD